MTHSFQDSFENSISQKEVDSLVQYNQENKCLTSTCIENECKTNIKKCNEVGGCQTETTESPACRTSHAFSVEDNTVAFSEIAETLSGNSNKFIWENTHCMKDYGSECNVNSYMSGYSARHLNTLTADDLYFKESKFLNSEVSDLPVSSAEDYALSQQGSKIDGHGDHIEEIFENNKQGQNAFPECICDQENASLQSDNYTTRTETKLPEKNMLTPQHFNERSSHEEEPNAKRMKNDRQWPDLQTHSLSAPLIAMSVAECASETSEVEVESVHPASKSSQELNMSIEPPSPTEDDLCNTKSLSKLKTENVPINYKPRFQKKSIEAQGDDKEHISSSDSPPVLCLKAVAYSTDNLTDIETNKYSSSITPLHDYINKNKEPRYQLETTNEQDKDNNDSMHFNSSDINPYIHPWQQDECCKMGWKQYVFGSASDVSGNPPPLSLDNQTVIRCSSVDNGLNSQNSPFHSHLKHYYMPQSTLGIHSSSSSEVPKTPLTISSTPAFNS
uniref:Uncharacterized protein n=1 Tax=Laticauda laticaudata TaxID=8630 RepID=A0A8C5WW25_LATLA